MKAICSRGMSRLRMTTETSWLNWPTINSCEPRNVICENADIAVCSRVCVCVSSASKERVCKRFRTLKNASPKAQGGYTLTHSASGCVNLPRHLSKGLCVFLALQACGYTHYIFRECRCMCTSVVMYILMGHRSPADLLLCSVTVMFWLFYFTST